MSVSKDTLISPDELKQPTRIPDRGWPDGADIDELEAELRANVEGEVRFDPGSKAMYAVDASNYRQVPIGVVIPRTKEDVVHAIATCRKFGAPVLSRGGGTSLAGQCCNVAVVIDWSKYMHGVLELNTVRALGAGLAGNGLRRVARPGDARKRQPADLGTRSGDPQSLLFWRNDRQQLLRRSRADGRQDGGEH